MAIEIPELGIIQETPFSFVIFGFKTKAQAAEVIRIVKAYPRLLEIAKTELKRASNRKCSGTYGPCGEADNIAALAEMALEEIEQALSESKNE